MKAIRFLAAAASALALWWTIRPEFARYAARIELGRCQNALLAIARQPSAPQSAEQLRAVAEILETAGASLPFDARASFLQGSDALLRREPAEALLRFADSLRLEERPETDLNLGRAEDGLGDAQAAAQWQLRAVWISPQLLSDLPEASRDAIGEIVGELEHELAAGSSSAVPPLPSLEAATGENNR